MKFYFWRLTLCLALATFAIVLTIGIGVAYVHSAHAAATVTSTCKYRSPGFDYYPGLQPTSGNAPLAVSAAWAKNWSYVEGVPNIPPVPTLFLNWGDGTTDQVPSVECPADPVNGDAFRDWPAQQMTHTYSTPGTFTVLLIGRTAGYPDGVSNVGTIIVQSGGTGCNAVSQNGSCPTSGVVATANAIKLGQAQPGWAGGRIPYVWGGGHRPTPGPSHDKGHGPVGLDCSGFTRWVYALSYGSDVLGAGNTNAQLAELQKTTTPQAGDLVFFGTSTTNTSHVGIYVGPNQMIDEPHTGAFVRSESISGFGHVVGYYTLAK